MHGDVWALVQIGFVGSESITQVEQFWRQIVLPFFGIPDLESIASEFGPPSPAATGEADRSGPVDTPIDTPAPSQDVSGAVAGGADQSGVSSHENNVAPSTAVSSEGAAEAATALVGAAGAAPNSGTQESGENSPAAGGAPVGGTNASTSPSAQGGDAGQNGAVQMEVDDVEGMRGGSGEGPESEDAAMAPESPAPSQGGGEEDMAGEEEEEEDGEAGDDDEDMGGEPEASEASKLEESDVDDLEESGGVSGPKEESKDGVDEEEDDEDDPAAHGLMSTPSKLPIDFNNPAKVGRPLQIVSALQCCCIFHGAS